MYRWTGLIVPLFFFAPSGCKGSIEFIKASSLPLKALVCGWNESLFRQPKKALGMSSPSIPWSLLHKERRGCWVRVDKVRIFPSRMLGFILSHCNLFCANVKFFAFLIISIIMKDLPHYATCHLSIPISRKKIHFSISFYENMAL